MKRIKRHKVKTEVAETSTSYNREQEVHDLAYYIHDRVELMHQVFSVLKYKELKAMVPASIRNISADDLQELCTEELLGISSKRLCAILDGADPPSDTESSSPSPPPEQMETISLDSISSDDEILSQTSNKKKKHKHHRHSRSKSKRKRSREQDDSEADKSKASRAGLTVLELLELQARARAIRAQLQQEQQQKCESEAASKEPEHASDNEVEIKEEPAEVVEISSDDEKPKVEDLQKKITEAKEAAAPQPQQTTVTKRINDLVITVPQKTKQKIKLNRNKAIPTTDKTTSIAATKKSKTPSVAIANSDKTTENKMDDDKNVKRDKSKKKRKGKKNVSKDDIDNDEITLQLSDTEKMDLLEDLDRKHYDSVSSDSSSESSSDSDADDAEERDATPGKGKDSEGKAGKENLESEKVVSEVPKDTNANENKDKSPGKAALELVTDSKKTDSDSVINTEESKAEPMEADDTVAIESNCETIEANLDITSEIVEKIDSNVKDSSVSSKDTVAENPDPAIKDNDTVAENEEVKEAKRNLSEGELSDRESSEVEAVDLKPEVVCISDEEGSNKAKKKKKKKEKKAKKEKRPKKKSDFRESGEQNFYKHYDQPGEHSSPKETQSLASIEVIDNTSRSETLNSSTTKTTDTVQTETIDKVDLTTAKKTIDDIEEHIKKEPITDRDITTHTESTAGPSDDDIEAVYEIMELSDDSSCCEVECTTTLSKEPTASEIEALSAKIDEIEREEIITDKEIREYERAEQEKAELDNIEHISWKDRYLGSKKVKKVLNTASILNALRKKNIDLKKKLAESKMEKQKDAKDENVLEEGSIEHYNTLETLTTYVDPVKELPKDLKKDAKLLLKMYKKLLKYNDMNKPEDPNKKRKKKNKKIKKDTKKGKETEDCVASVVNIENKEVNVEDRE